MISTALYIKTASHEYIEVDSSVNLCYGSQEPDVPATQLSKGGVPLQSSKERSVLIWNCSGDSSIGAPETGKTSTIFAFMSTWQFYVNWLIWSTPFLGMAYILGKRNANIRH